ncbi:GlsB/YeaQ/YmgE family stress response membrane protein [Candidatus Nomurabacteria bacterium]|jgi:uncharacterized membrane protein YeaQ/YmgE (transglycosylase-associated protein family)|nr:GlsB/YeaQ/YmgE family stress response membrane protein [Candidatus Saccharibacteria bacterium]MCB9821771.1 GlsB/YeaQ/YmgE family stress response membrane protein [Candidatus Nomurabacteria bacterium]
MGILAWIVLGALAGWITSILLKTNSQQGAIGNIIMGIVGALIGGYLGSAFFDLDITGINLTSIILAIGGSLIFALLIGIITGKKSV